MTAFHAICPYLLDQLTLKCLMSVRRSSCANKVIAIAAAAMVVLTGCIGSSDSESDGDGTALFAEQVLNCSSAVKDSDGDGWGWENGRTCKSDIVEPAEIGHLPVGIVYYLWHCITKTEPYQTRYANDRLANGEEYNIYNVLTGAQRDWGDEFFFHWWDEPDLGYYCLGDNPEVLRKHVTMLRDAGIDYLAVDITNHPNVKSLSAEEFIIKSFVPLLEAADSIEGAPKIVPWVPLASENVDTLSQLDLTCGTNNQGNLCNQLTDAHTQSMYEYVTTLLDDDYPNLKFTYKDKPLLLEASNDDIYPRSVTDLVRPELEQDWTVRPTWGLKRTNNEWQFLSTCSSPVEFYNSSGWSPNGCNQPVNAGEQISVAAGYQYTYISEPFKQNPSNPDIIEGGMPKFHGRTLAQQFRVAFEQRNTKPMVLITGWNEWIASRFTLDGRVAFVDLYDFTRNRDIEPGGRSGDLYYFLMRSLIAKYRSGEPFDLNDYFLTEETILDTDYYWSSYQDLQGAFQQTDAAGLRTHWLSIGMQEGRRPSVAFDAQFYSGKYPDLASGGVTTAAGLLRHFLDSGFAEGRQGSSEFLASAYLNRYVKIRTLFGSNGYFQAFRYFVTEGQFAPDNHNPRP